MDKLDKTKTYSWEHMKIKNFRIYKKDYLPKEFIIAILELYKKKTELKDIVEFAIEYLNSKELVDEELVRESKRKADDKEEEIEEEPGKQVIYKTVKTGPLRSTQAKIIRKRTITKYGRDRDVEEDIPGDELVVRKVKYGKEPKVNDVESIKKINEELKGKISILEESIKELNSKIDEEKEKYEAQNKQCEEMRIEHSKLFEKNSFVADGIKRIESEIKRIEGEKEELINSRAGNNDEIEAKLAQIEEIKISIEKGKDEIIFLNDENS